MTEAELPDRLCSDPRSPFYNEALLTRGVGVRAIATIRPRLPVPAVERRPQHGTAEN